MVVCGAGGGQGYPVVELCWRWRVRALSAWLIETVGGRRGDKSKDGKATVIKAGRAFDRDGEHLILVFGPRYSIYTDTLMFLGVRS